MALDDEQERFLAVYRNAERRLFETVVEETRSVVDATETAPATAGSQRARSMRNVRAAAEQAATGLDRHAAARLDRVLTTAAEEGADAAIAELGEITGRGASQYADRINRGALDRMAVATADRLTDAHRSILRTVPDQFRSVIERVMSGNLIGAETGREAAQRAVWEWQRRGITGFTDRAGRRWGLTSYAEMATRTASARAKVDGHLDKLRAAGHELVLVSHTGMSCARCRPWENQILRIDGPDGPGIVQVEDAIEDDVFIDVQVAGSVAEARLAGLMHPNCGHSLSAYLPGVTQPARPDRDPKRDKALYEATQRQREIEREIRRTKEMVDAEIDPVMAKKAKAKVRDAQAKMREHLDANPELLRYRDREQPGAGFLPDKAMRDKLAAEPPL